jgi:hypothetical protein
MLLIREIEWLADRLMEEYPHLKNKTVKNHPELTPRDWLKLRIQWGIPKGFVYFWGDRFGTYGGLMIRPVNDRLIRLGTYDYWGTIWDFEPEGDICWVDYAYGPGLYPKMIAICRSTGLPRFGWRHRNRVHVKLMCEMPTNGMAMSYH